MQDLGTKSQRQKRHEGCADLTVPFQAACRGSRALAGSSTRHPFQFDRTWFGIELSCLGAASVTR